MTQDSKQALNTLLEQLTQSPPVTLPHWGASTPIQDLFGWMLSHKQEWVLLHQSFEQDPMLQGLFDLQESPETPLPFVISKHDLHRMQDMGLGALPVCCVAMPLNCMPRQLTLLHRLVNTPLSAEVLKPAKTYAKTLTSVFSVSFVAALYELQSIFRSLEVQAYLIGGLPRDLMRLSEDEKQTIYDVDLTVEADASVLAEYVVKHSKNFKLTGVFSEFGTAKLMYKDILNFDLASTRLESYPKSGALPDVIARGVPLAQDILRRDFTINTLVFSLNQLGDIYDLANGLQDLEEGQIRVLQGASFFEDPTRILRALQFQARFQFELSLETLYLMRMYFRYAALIHYKGGGARMTATLRRFLRQPENSAKAQAFDTLLSFHGTQLLYNGWCLDGDATTTLLAQQMGWQTKLQQLKELFARGLEDIDFEVQEDVLSHRNHTTMSSSTKTISAPTYGRQGFGSDDGYRYPSTLEGSSGSAVLGYSRFESYTSTVVQETQALPVSTGDMLTLAYLCLLLGHVSEKDYAHYSSRLELTRHERELITRYHTLQHTDWFMHPPEVLHPKWVYKLFHGLPDLSAWTLVFLSPHFKQALAWYQQYTQHLKHLKVTLSGHDLIALGVPAGETIGKALQSLLEEKLAGNLKTVEEETHWLKTHWIP